MVNTTWLDSNQRLEEKDVVKQVNGVTNSIIPKHQRGESETKISNSYLILTISLSAENEKHKKGDSQRQKQK